jgi:pyrroloquinoline quinone biosynthesis protein D
VNRILFKFTAQDRPYINPHFQLRWDEIHQAFVLVHPDGIVSLNETASEILSRCDGERSVGDLIGEMTVLYPDSASEVEAGVHRFLELAYANRWIRREP